MPALARRAALATPLLLLALPARARFRVPPFQEWVGRTAKLNGDSGQARLLLEANRTGTIAVRLLFFCKPLPVLDWTIADDGLTLSYRRQSAISATRIIQGTARITAEPGLLQWIEAADHLAEFEGFEGPEAVRVCG
ncbi:hypothetical protein [Falsiroseomonas stagni]|uniref:Uncharacterized protein n=1 Tax=Falsiroseomonas stagni DSM 19981 TaxID=1123062 RepID=A0A1I4E591_9PROT|nr:hypothetical protein [Falsiroseomonas stagni]SFK99331.1 hypothetical protein SAMN02745775_113115 [Falsiroseomonas stagni DSM 19981]